MVEREKEMSMVKVWSHGCEVSEYEVEDRQCLYMDFIMHILVPLLWQSWWLNRFG